MRRDSLLVLGLLIALCLLGGLVLGVATGRWSHIGPVATPTPVTPTPTLTPQIGILGEQKSLLIVGVDDASSARPGFEGCWVLTYRPGSPEYYFSIFPPDSKFELGSLPDSQTLAAIFALDLNQQLGFRFMRDAIESRFPALKPQAEVIVDRRALAELIDQAGGVSIAGTSLDGLQVLDAYGEQTVQSMPERMAFQETIIRALLGRLVDSNWTPERLTLFFQQWPGSNAVQLEGFAAGAPQLAGSGIHWTVYTPELETSSKP